MTTQMPRFLDIEASSLSNISYPIEIAWFDGQGNIESYLISPNPIGEWTDWDYYAQHEIHGISRAMCSEKGIHSELMCQHYSGHKFTQLFVKSHSAESFSIYSFCLFKITSSSHISLERT